jgi:hypothetical protein
MVLTPMHHPRIVGMFAAQPQAFRFFQHRPGIVEGSPRIRRSASV